MSVKYLVDDIIEEAPGWARAKVRRKMNEAQDILYSTANKESIYIDPSTGFPQYLPTTTTDLEYSIPDVTMTLGGSARTLRIKRVLRVFVDASSIDNHELNLVGDPFEYYCANPYSSRTEKLFFSEVEVTSFEARELDKARIIFPYDPSTTTETFYIECLIEPLQITSDTIPFTIEKRFERAIFDYVVGSIQDSAYGKPERLDKFYDYWVPKFLYENNQGVRGNTKGAATFI